jgi:hypothetical protein
MDDAREGRGSEGEGTPRRRVPLGPSESQQTYAPMPSGATSSAEDPDLQREVQVIADALAELGEAGRGELAESTGSRYWGPGRFRRALRVAVDEGGIRHVARGRYRAVEEEDRPVALGHTRWAIAEGHIPGRSTGPEPAMTSHETACLLNTSAEVAHVEITLFFADRDPVGPYRVTVPPRRTMHMRFNELEDPEPVPRDTDYASVIESDVPIVVQHSRLDSRQAQNALITTVAYAAD